MVRYVVKSNQAMGWGQPSAFQVGGAGRGCVLEGPATFAAVWTSAAETESKMSQAMVEPI